MTGRIYAVGVGPGDPELVTRKAERILREADVVCAPTGAAEASSYALSIVEEFLDRSRQEIIVQVFPMRKDPAELEEFWHQAASEVVERVREGKNVAFITIGDPFLYSTFLYLYRIFLEEHPEIPLEIVPGISSINAAAAAGGFPLGMASERIAILPATYEVDGLVETLVKYDTVILMKVNRVFDRVYDIIKQLQPPRKGVFVSRAGSAREQVVTDLDSLVGQELDYLSLLIVKKVPDAAHE